MSNHDDLLIFETDKMPNSHKGFYSDGVVLIDDRLNPRKKTEVLAEEIAHHKITYGDILDDKSIYKRKFELKARRCGYELLITLDGIISAYKNGVHNLYELANYFEPDHKGDIFDFIKWSLVYPPIIKVALLNSNLYRCLNI